MAVAEDDGPVAHAVQQLLVVVCGVGWKLSTSESGEPWTYSSPSSSVSVGSEYEPVDELVRIRIREVLVHLHHLGPILGRLLQPALAVAANPGRVRKLLQADESLLGHGLGVP